MATAMMLSAMPLRRSPVFWLGLFLNLLLVGTWVDSMSWISYCRRESWGFTRVASRRGALEFQQVSFMGEGGIPAAIKADTFWHRERLGPAEFAEWFPWVRDAPPESSGAPRKEVWRHTLWRLPYWLLLLLSLSGWLVLLWRARHLAKASREAVPGGSPV